MCKVDFLAKSPENPLYTKQSPDNPLYTSTLHINIIIAVAAKKPSPPCTPFFNILTPTTLNSLCSPPPPIVYGVPSWPMKWTNRTGPKSLVDAVNWIPPHHRAFIQQYKSTPVELLWNDEDLCCVIWRKLDVHNYKDRAHTIISHLLMRAREDSSDISWSLKAATKPTTWVTPNEDKRLWWSFDRIDFDCGWAAFSLELGWWWYEYSYVKEKMVMLEEDTILIQQPTNNIVINNTPHYSNRIGRKCLQRSVSLGVRIIDHARPLACPLSSWIWV